MPTGDLPDPYVNYNFHVEIDGISRAAFQEVTGLDSTIDVIEHREGGWNTTPHKFPGQTKHANLVLKHGMDADKELFDWHRAVVEGTTDRRNGAIILLDRRAQEVARWNFVRAWPSKYTGPSLNAESNDVSVETVELVHEGLERVS
jgi:phage tail-like protein